MNRSTEQVKEEIIRLKKEGISASDICRLAHLRENISKLTNNNNNWQNEVDLKILVRRTLEENNLLDFIDMYDLDLISKLEEYNEKITYKDLFYIVGHSECILSNEYYQDVFRKILTKVNLSPVKWASLLKKGDSQLSVDFITSDDKDKSIHVNDVIIETLIKSKLTLGVMEVICTYIVFEGNSDYYINNIKILLKHPKTNSKILNILYQDDNDDIKRLVVSHQKASIDILLDAILNRSLEVKVLALCNKNCPNSLIVLGIHEILKEESYKTLEILINRIENSSTKAEIFKLLKIY